MLLFLCPIISILEVLLLLFDLFISNKDPELTILSFEIFYTSMAIVSFLIFFINRFFKKDTKKNARKILVSTYIYCFFILLWAFFMTYIDYTSGFSPSIGLFFVCVTVVGSIFYLNPIIMAAVLFLMLIVQILTMIFIFKMPPKALYMPNTYIFTLAGIVLSLARYRSLIREVKQSSQIKQAMLEAEKANKAKSSFLAVMSHEIRTPMNAIVGLTDISLRENLPFIVKENLRQVKSAGASLLTIINDILDFSKIESGRLEIVPAKYDIISLFADTASLVNVRIGNKSLLLNLQVNSELPYLLFGDDVRTKQVILNLASNAVKFTQTGSVSIIIDFDKITEQDSSSDKMKILLKVKIIDTGIGIKKEDISKLFSSFSQVDMQHNRKKEGSGLGLAISKQLIELMNGNIGVESEYGKGSTFFFSIPQIVDKNVTIKEFYNLNEELIPNSNMASLDLKNLLYNEKFTSKYEDQRNSLSKKFTAPDVSILIVDDNPLNLQVAEGLLRPYQFKIDLASSGFEALEKVQEKSHNLVFLDHMMPGMDGVETAQKMAEIKSYKDGKPFSLPILTAWTANALGDNQKMFLNNGFSDFVAKPIDLDDLNIKLQKLIPPEMQLLDNTGTTDNTTSSDLSPLSEQGLDITSALKNTGNENNLISVLKTFVKTSDKNQRDISKLSASILENEKSNQTQEIIDNTFNDFTIQVHSLKSSARTIGAMNLSEMSKKLEEKGLSKDSADIKTKVQELLSEYKKITDVISENLIKMNVIESIKNEKSSLQNKPTFVETDISKELTEIICACNEFDEDKILNQLKLINIFNLSNKQKQLINSITDSIESFDFDECKKIIEDYQEK